MPAIKFLILPFPDLRRRLNQSVIYDWAMRFPVMVYCSFVLGHDVVAFCQQVAQNPSAFEDFDSGIMLAMLARISQWLFVLLLSVQPLFRLRAIAKTDEILPRAAALATIAIPLLFMEIERAPPNAAFNLAAVILSLIGNVMCVVTASFLGRSLSVMPEARQLVRGGPYAIVRHPLYPCEMLGTFAIALQYRSIIAAVLFGASIALQVARAKSEEAVLARTFPEYAAYRAATPFMVPRDPVRFLASFVMEPAMRWRSACVVVTTVAVLGIVATALPRLLV